MNFGSRSGTRSGMGRPLTIGEAAKAADVRTSTVRYYEREGILRPTTRSASNYRLYSDEDVHRLRFIRAAQATGFTLQDITELLRPTACRRVQRLIEDRLGVVAERMKELRHVHKVLKASLDTCQKHEETGRCKVIAELSASVRAKRL